MPFEKIESEIQGYLKDFQEEDNRQKIFFTVLKIQVMKFRMI